LIVRISEDAERDLIDGIAFYDQHGKEIGSHFFDSLMSDLRSLAVLGGVHAIRFGYHCMAAKRFPYAIYYLIADDVVLVLAILDERRDPDWIQRRLARG
jgi:plasmid stabilization system protein ParE